FAHSAIQRTVAPWDGAAVQLYLSEKELVDKKNPPPHALIQIYKRAAELSGQRVRMDGKRSREGGATWVQQRGERTPLAWAEIEFEGVEEGKPVSGKYEVALPDGTRERGRFAAVWWPAEGPGG